MTLQELYKTLRLSLSESDALYMIKKRLELSHADMISHPEKIVDPQTVLSDLEQHKQGLPLSRIYGEREFWGMSFKLSDSTLDPRADTETLIDAVIRRYPDKEQPLRILDLGTGSGCILIALLTEFPNARGVGIDLSQDAVTTAQHNAKENLLMDRSRFEQGNWAESIEERFDLVVSNPPYIENQVIQNLDESVKKHDPILALDGGEDGLQEYKKIFSGLFRLLNKGGRAFFEIGFDQEESVTRLSKESRFSVQSTYADLAGHIRVLELVPENSSGDK